jgi:aryl-alcohol dehydrogenase-like predicted oxidoreductase
VIVPRNPHEPLTPEMLEALRDAWPHPERIVVAMRVAGDVDTCAALLRGDPVNPDRLDQEGLRWARERRLVRLDLRAIDLLTRSAA